MKLRTQIMLFLFVFAMAPLTAMVMINFPLVFDRLELFYHRAYLQNLRADFHSLDRHLASRHDTVRLLAKLPDAPLLVSTSKGNWAHHALAARARFTDWVNHILDDQLDISRIVFVAAGGTPRFWLDRDPATGKFSGDRPFRDPMPQAFVSAGLRPSPGGVIISPIRINRDAGERDPSRLMTLQLMTPIKSESESAGGVVIDIDVGGMAQAYRDYFWVHDNGDYLRVSGADTTPAAAFRDFPGLKDLFTLREAGLWKGDDGHQVMWVPVFATEAGDPLWVGREVDPSPILGFSDELKIRVVVIVVGLIVLMWFVSRWVGVRAERFGRELTTGISRVLSEDKAVRFVWAGPHELQALGTNLSRLAETHAEHSRALREHARELEESNRYKSEFLANVSHELRTPLNSILLLSKLLAQNEAHSLTAEQVKQAHVIHQAGSDLRALIDNILDLSRIEARKTILKIEPVDLPRLIDGLMDLIKPQFVDKDISLDLVVEPDATLEVVSDPDRLSQIIKNFLSNAVKFTEHGGVTIVVGTNRGADAERRPVRISVHDTGIGIPADKHGAVFEAFQQADGSTSRRYGGTGLGLTISRELAQLIGGRIELESVVDEGSTFSLLLPRAFEQAPSVEQSRPQRVQQDSTPRTVAIPEADFGQERILVVDDDVRNLLALTPMLEGWGLDVTAAGDGREALETLADEPDFGLVLLDIMMPELDGYETLRRIRAQSRFARLPVVALTAKAAPEDAAACMAAGADGYLSKPVDPAQLLDELNRYLEPPGPVTTSGPAARVAA
jgi:signal transduction histidine kinase/ActR/RegA family two-component response regulator